MSLVLGLALNDSFYVDDTKVTLVSYVSQLRFSLKVCTACLNIVFEITDKKSTEILTNVLVSAGNNGAENVFKVAIKAPKVIRIQREKIYLEQRKT